MSSGSGLRLVGVVVAVALGLVVVAAPEARATAFTWEGDVDALWDTDGNWGLAGSGSPGAADDATFDDTGVGNNGGKVDINTADTRTKEDRHAVGEDRELRDHRRRHAGRHRQDYPDRQCGDDQRQGRRGCRRRGDQRRRHDHHQRRNQRRRHDHQDGGRHARIERRQYVHLRAGHLCRHRQTRQRRRAWHGRWRHVGCIARHAGPGRI